MKVSLKFRVGVPNTEHTSRPKYVPFGAPYEAPVYRALSFLENDYPTPLEEMWTATTPSCRDHINPKPKTLNPSGV